MANTYYSWPFTSATSTATTNRIDYWWQQNTTTTASNVWQTWTSPVYTTGNTNYRQTTERRPATRDTVWTIWNGDNAVYRTVLSDEAAARGMQYQVTLPSFQPVVETEEQRAERLEAERIRREEYAAKEAERLKLKAAADARAKELLTMLLDEEQQVEYERQGSFVVKVRDPRDQRFRSFRILCTGGVAGNVRELNEEGRAIRSGCIHLRGPQPNHDHFAAQKLLLEDDLPEFERIANWSRMAA